MSTIKKTTKKTTKIAKPKYIVDLTDIETPADMELEFIKAKVLAGVAITEEEFKFVLRFGAHIATEAFKDAFLANATQVTMSAEDANDIIDYIKDKIYPKTPWYKRAWNWITKPFKRKK